MSFTFSIEALPTGSFTAECYDSGVVLAAADYDGITAAMAAHKATCEECGVYGMFSCADVDVDASVNFANGNAAMILTRLGYDVEDAMSGGFTVPADDFLGRVLLAGATGVPDDGIAPAAHVAAGGATFVDCGVRPGYFTQALGDLQVLAETARGLGRDIVGC